MLQAGLSGGYSLAAGGKTSWSGSTLEDLSVNRADRCSGGTLGAWTGVPCRNNGGTFSGKLFWWIFAVGHATIKPFLVSLVFSCGERRGCPEGVIGRFWGQAILTVGHSTIRLFLVTLVASCGKQRGRVKRG